MCAVLLILHLNISANMPVSSTSAGRTFGIHFLCLCRQSTSYGIQRSDWKTIWILLRIPAAIGLVMADLAVKSSPVEVIKYMTPDQGTSHSNEVIVAVTGDADAVKNAVLTARDVGLQLLVSMGSYPESPATPYLQ